MAFWRRSKGRHALGAAVTSIPAAPPRLVLPAAPLPAAPLPAQDWSFPAPGRGPRAVPAVPRVQLPFRAVASASLVPIQARALEEIPQVLPRRDEVKH